jgi:hypothetical protein
MQRRPGQHTRWAHGQSANMHWEKMFPITTEQRKVTCQLLFLKSRSRLPPFKIVIFNRRQT